MQTFTFHLSQLNKSHWQVYFIAIPTPYVHYVSFISSIITLPASRPQIVKTLPDGNRRRQKTEDT